MPAREPKTDAEWKEMYDWTKSHFRAGYPSAYGIKPWVECYEPNVGSYSHAKYNWDTDCGWKANVRPAWEAYCDSLTGQPVAKVANKTSEYICSICYRVSRAGNCEWCDDTRYRNSEKYKEEQKQKAKEYVRQAMLVQLRAYPRHCEADMKINSGVVDNNLCVIYSCLHCDKRETFKLTPRK